MAEYFASLDFFGWLEIVSVILGFTYVSLEVKKLHLMWLFNIICSCANMALYMHKSFTAMALLQIFYIVMAIYGVIQWRKVDKVEVKEEEKDKKIRVVKMSRKQGVVSTAIALVAIAVLVPVFAHYGEVRGADMYRGQALLDTSMAVLSLLGTYWLSRSYMENWYMWVLVNVISVGMFIAGGLYWMAALYSMYLVLSFIGIAKWRRDGVFIDEEENSL